MTQTRKNKTKHNAKRKRVFTRKEYNSGDGMLTASWGPAIWHYLHMMSFNYPVEPTADDKNHYKDFILSLQYVLPCKYCRINLTNNFKKKPLQMCHMARYVYELHETINRMLHKKSALSYCQVRERYEHFRSRCTEENPKVFKFKRTLKNRTKETGCTEPLYGKKSKCIINIVPQEDKVATFNIDKQCIKRRD